MVTPEVFSCLDTLSAAAAERFVALASEAARSRGRFAVALAGGSTPRTLYELLGTAPLCELVPWAVVHAFWGDERCVPPNDDRSNYRLADRSLLRHVPITEPTIHRIRGEIEPEAAAAEYDRQLRDFFKGERATFDLVLLGLGADGHTASLFPGALPSEADRWVAAVRPAGQETARVTLTPAVLNASRRVLFLVSGADKSSALRRVLAGDPALPASLIRPSRGDVEFFIDRAAEGE